MVWFFELLTPFTLRAFNFINLFFFLTIFNVLDAPIKRVQILFGHQKQWSPLLGFGLPWTFEFHSCNSIATQFTTNEELKDLTHMFCLGIPCYKQYKKGLFSNENTCAILGSTQKNLTWRQNKNLKNKISWLVLNSLSLVLS